MERQEAGGRNNSKRKRHAKEGLLLIKNLKNI